MKTIFLLLLTLGCFQLASSQISLKRHYLERAQVSDDATAGTMTVAANAYSPLFQALQAVSARYGWAVNWEEAPIYSRLDTFDCTDSEWRSHHPQEKGVTCPSGGSFTSTLPRSEVRPGPDEEKATLEKLVDDYNKSDNPGKYKVLEADGGLAIVGVKVLDDKGHARDVTPLLDTVLELPLGKRSVDDTVDLILQSLSSSTGAKTGNLSLASHLRQATQVELGGRPATARELLNEALASTGRPLTYYGGFSVRDNTFYLRIGVAGNL